MTGNDSLIEALRRIKEGADNQRAFTGMSWHGVSIIANAAIRQHETEQNTTRTNRAEPEVTGEGHGRMAVGSSSPETLNLETDPQMLQRLGMDGHLWAKEFNKYAAKLYPSVSLDEGWLIGWFCNAVMAGYDKAKQRARCEIPVIDYLILEIAVAKALNPYVLGFDLKDCVDDVLAAIAMAPHAQARPSDEVKYFGVESFTDAQKLAYKVGYQHGTTDAKEEREAQPAGDDREELSEIVYLSYQYACRLLLALAPEVEALSTLQGVLSQIDNAVTAFSKREISHCKHEEKCPVCSAKTMVSYWKTWARSYSCESCGFRDTGGILGEPPTTKIEDGSANG